jgi:hypothetical protein
MWTYGFPSFFTLSTVQPSVQPVGITDKDTCTFDKRDPVRLTVVGVLDWITDEA